MLQVSQMRATIDKSMEKTQMVESENVIGIEISKKAHEKLRGLQESLQKILRKKKVSYTQVIMVMFAVTRLDDTLIQMQLEA
jgi:hypothetical protein